MLWVIVEDADCPMGEREREDQERSRSVEITWPLNLSLSSQPRPSVSRVVQMVESPWMFNSAYMCHC